MHFVVGTVYFYTLAYLHVFEVKPLPVWNNLQLTVSFVGSIGLMNVSLSINSLGFFQLTKMMVSANAPVLLLMLLLRFEDLTKSNPVWTDHSMCNGH